MFNCSDHDEHTLLIQLRELRSFLRVDWWEIGVEAVKQEPNKSPGAAIRLMEDCGPGDPCKRYTNPVRELEHKLTNARAKKRDREIAEAKAADARELKRYRES